MVAYAFVWEKGKIIDCLEIIIVYDLKLITDDRGDKNFVPWDCMPPASAYIHVLNHEKICNIRLQRDFFETSNK